MLAQDFNHASSVILGELIPLERAVRVLERGI